ncbi:MAG TPA: hypothetical protein VN026_18255 [Bacteroidia bacterium]|jgi:hypothetical protein|nr:hypothetical protein [Bacteroidia bacterium]
MNITNNITPVINKEVFNTKIGYSYIGLGRYQSTTGSSYYDKIKDKLTPEQKHNYNKHKLTASGYYSNIEGGYGCNSTTINKSDYPQSFNSYSIKIRFNTENKGSLFWRVLIDNKEYLANSVDIQVPVKTTMDTLEDGKTKFHISCNYNELIWEENKNLIIK